MNNDLVNELENLRGIVNNFSITGEGVSGDLTEGYLVEFSPSATQPMDLPEGPERPETPEQ